MADFEQIRIDRLDGGIAAVVVARADIGNASSPEMLGEIREAFSVLTTDRDVRAIIFSAEGKHFSVGADFAFLQRLSGMNAVEIKDTVYANFQGAARAIYRCPKPTLALVQGAAVTVGCELALAWLTMRCFRKAGSNLASCRRWAGPFCCRALSVLAGQWTCVCAANRFVPKKPCR